MRSSTSQLLLRISTYFLIIMAVCSIYNGVQSFRGKSFSWTLWWMGWASVVMYPLCFENRVKSLAQVLGSEAEALEAMRELGEARKQ